MNVGNRIRKIREIRGFKQTVVAQEMNVTQQAYSCFEKGTNNYRLETLARFCDAMKVELPFLLSEVPITEETIVSIGEKKYGDIFSQFNKVESENKVLRDLLQPATP